MAIASAMAAMMTMIIQKKITILQIASCHYVFFLSFFLSFLCLKSMRKATVKSWPNFPAMADAAAIENVWKDWLRVVTHNRQNQD